MVPTNTPTDTPENGPASVPVTTPTPAPKHSLEDAKAGALAMVAAARKGDPAPTDDSDDSAEEGKKPSPHHVRLPADVPSPSDNFTYNAETVLGKLQSNLQVLLMARRQNATLISAHRAGNWLIVGGWQSGTQVQSDTHDQGAFWYSFSGNKLTVTDPPATTSAEVFRERYQCLF